MSPHISKGLVQIYTGDGKGKTTAALGLAVRAAGRGLKVCIIQFCKGETSGEHLFIEKFPAFEILRPGESNCFKASEQDLKAEAQKTLLIAEEKILSGKYDLIVLDEINIAVWRKFISVEQVLNLLTKKPDSLELVLTGRYAPQELIDKADLVTEMKLVKHNFQQGIYAREGIEK